MAELKKTIVFALFGVALFSSAITYAMTQTAQTQPSSNESVFAMGHITAILRDGDGNIKVYRQTDNEIVDVGLDIIAEQVFGNGTTTSTLANQKGTVKAMGIGTGGDLSVAATDTDLTTAVGGSCNNATAAFTESTGSTGTTLVHVFANVTFAGSSCAATVDEAGLFTSTGGGPTSTSSPGDTFALQEFTGIVVNAADSLQLNWDIRFDDT